MHAPAWHVSVCVQSIGVVAGRFRWAALGPCTLPSPYLHVPTPWHWSKAVQTTGLAPVHTLPSGTYPSACNASVSSQVGSVGQRWVRAHSRPRVYTCLLPWHWSEAVHTTGLAPEHAPVWQVSVCVQRSPSSQPVPSGNAGSEQTPVPGLHVPTPWHWSEAVHTTGLAPEHAPVWQVSVCVQRSPSSQPVPSGNAGSEQTPVPGLHVPTPWHWSEAVHTTGLAPEHAPVWQVSVCVQRSPSSQPVPSGNAGSEQTPVPGLHVPTPWHWSEAVHTTGLAPEHAPVWQVSVCVQRSPSSQGVPSGNAGSEQTPVPGLHVPTPWHWSEAVHTTGLAPEHAPV